MLPEDTGDTPERATQAAQHAVAEGAQLMLGPLFAPSVAAVAPIAAAAHLTVISFTTDAAQASGNVYVMGFLPSLEVQRIVGFAQRQNVHSFAMLAPDNAYGALTATTLQTLVPNATVVRFPAGAMDFSAARTAVEGCCARCHPST